MGGLLIAALFQPAKYGQTLQACSLGIKPVVAFHQTADSSFPGVDAGSLVMKNERGRTYFSVNDRKFADNDGYFEFEVELR